MTNLTHSDLRRKSPEYQSWKAMLKRCKNPNHRSYHQYGGRGVKVCDRWDPAKDGGFNNFLVDMFPRPEGTTLDKDMLGDGMLYSPENCCWLGPKEQAQFSRNKCRFYPNSMAHRARAAGLSPDLVRLRINRLGWSVERALNTPVRSKQPHLPTPPVVDD